MKDGAQMDPSKKSRFKWWMGPLALVGISVVIWLMERS